MTHDELTTQQALTYKRYYEYKCLLGCGKKRKTRSYKVAKGRACTACKKRKLGEAIDERQINLFQI